MQEYGDKDQKYGTSAFFIMWQLSTRYLKEEGSREGLKSIRILIHHTIRKGEAEKRIEEHQAFAERSSAERDIREGDHPKYEHFFFTWSFPLFLSFLSFSVLSSPLIPVSSLFQYFTDTTTGEAEGVVCVTNAMSLSAAEVVWKVLYPLSPSHPLTLSPSHPLTLSSSPAHLVRSSFDLPNDFVIGFSSLPSPSQLLLWSSSAPPQLLLCSSSVPLLLKALSYSIDVQ